MTKLMLDPRVVRQGREAGAQSGSSQTEQETLGMGLLTGNPPTGHVGPGMSDLAVRKIAAGPGDAIKNREAAARKVGAQTDPQTMLMYVAGAVVVAWVATRVLSRG